MSATITSPAPTTGTTSSAATTQERALLAKLLKTYQTDLNNGQKAGALTGLGKQITDTAKLLGQTVTLPKAAAGSAPPSSAPPSSAAAVPEPATDGAKVNLKA